MKVTKRVKWIGLLVVAGLIVLYFLYPTPQLPADAKIDRIVVIKSKRLLIVYSGPKELKSYRISLGRQPVGKKQVEGDNKTPEGIYLIISKNPHSRYYKSFGISYPNQEDIDTAKRIGKSPGSAILIHGAKTGFGFLGRWLRLFDWTQGCIALTNSEMDELYNLIDIGTTVEIRP
ncbi:MAG: murein L,D-transpeptidase family protein [bacterium]